MRLQGMTDDLENLDINAISFSYHDQIYQQKEQDAALVKKVEEDIEAILFSRKGEVELCNYLA